MRPLPVAIFVVFGGTTPAASQVIGAGQRARFDAWGVSYTVPAGWQLSQQAGRVHTLLTPAGPQGPVIYLGRGCIRASTTRAPT